MRSESEKKKEGDSTQAIYVIWKRKREKFIRTIKRVVEKDLIVWCDDDDAQQ